MASIVISEEDFMVVAGAARDAQQAGNMEEALALDKVARKMNAALSRDSATAKIARYASGGKSTPFSWKDVPSTLDPESV